VVEEIKNRIERENLQNARMQAEIKEKRSQAEVFAHKGGKLRAVAKRMREAAEEAEENIVEVRQEDRTIREFEIPCQEFDKFFDGKVMEFSAVSSIKAGELVEKPFEFVLRKNTHVLISGPNGIGKTTLLEKIASGLSLRGVPSSEANKRDDEAISKKKGLPRQSQGPLPRNDNSSGFTIAKDIVIGYYKQDFSNFNFEQKAYDALVEVMQKTDDHHLRSVAAGFLLDGKLLDQQIAALSEGQKGLLAFCRLVLQKPGLLILDEPTNHINFRHLPIIAQALDSYKGASIMVSHIPDFVSQIRVDQSIDLSSI
jgi:ATP-binding cassette subfamily F protein 3